MPIDVDLVIAFRASQKATISNRQAKEEIKKAEQQYSQLLETLSYGGLKAVGRRGETLGHLLVFVACPEELLRGLVRRERQSDFLSGLPATPIANEADTPPLSPSDRLRLIHAYITSIPTDGGLGITPGSSEWDLVESVFCLHDREFNERWIHAWTTNRMASVPVERIRDQFGDSVALYFSFLDGYTRALVFPAIIGVSFYLFGTSYSPLYSILTVLWSIGFVEWWRVRERIISLRFGTRGSFRVEKRRAQYNPNFSWWQRELRMLASVPVILVFVALLGVIMTGIFMLEAFVTQLYTGPGHTYISFSPTILFVVLVPRLVSIFQVCAERFTSWENHAHHSSHSASLTIKTFVFTALVAYLGLALSAFVYVPFGEGLMRIVQVWLFQGTVPLTGDQMNANITAEAPSGEVKARFWESDASSAEHKINPGRLKDQMFAYTVTNQIVDTFVEIGLPYITRAVTAFTSKRKAKSKASPSSSSLSVASSSASAPASGTASASAFSSTSTPGKKKVVFEDEKEKGGQEEKQFLEIARHEATLSDYDVFNDYSEMVIQFGYVALWSTIWPLAPVMALANNVLESRSDAFKITVHERRGVPVRTDTIGPWLDALGFLTWVGALTNGALVYLFCPRGSDRCIAAASSASASASGAAAGAGAKSVIERVHDHLVATAGQSGIEGIWGSGGGMGEMKEMLGMALVVALVASHGYLVVRSVIRHVVERVVWGGSEEVREMEREERRVKEGFLRAVGGLEGAGGGGAGGVGGVGLGLGRVGGVGGVGGDEKKGEEGEEKEVKEGEDDYVGFWEHDDGIDEIQRISKEA